MVQPTSATTLQRPDLGEIAYEYMEGPAGFGMMGLDILPIFPVMEKSADYPVIPNEAILKVQNVKRQPRGNYNRSDWEFETKTYACEERGWEEAVERSERNNYMRLFDLEVEAANRANTVIMRAQEVDIATLLFNATTFSGRTSGVTTEWSTAATATPRADILTAQQASLIYLDAGACSLKVFQNLVNTAEVKEALKYTNPIEMGGLEAQRQMVAQYLGLDNLFVSNAKKDTAKKGQSTSGTDIWDDEYFLVFKRATQSSMREPALGRTFLWTPDSPNILTVDQYEEPQSDSDIYRVRHNADEVVQFTGAGYLLSNITA
jgi:hypothetical protein